MSRDEGYETFLRVTTPHLLLTPLRPILGVRRWLVRSQAYTTMRPVVAWGDEIRARQRGQRVHAAHARAREAVRQDIDADIAGTYLVRREYRLIWADHPDAAERCRRDRDGEW